MSIEENMDIVTEDCDSLVWGDVNEEVQEVQEEEEKPCYLIKPNVSYASALQGTKDQEEYESDDEPGYQQEETKNESKQETKRMCKFFNSRRGCNKGTDCTYLHEQQVCAFFVSEQGCSAAKDCPFIHDSNAIPSVTLKPCPNSNCKNLCIGKQCMQCHARMNPDTGDQHRRSNRDNRSSRDNRSYRHLSSREPYNSSSRFSNRDDNPKEDYRIRSTTRSSPRNHPYRSNSYAGREYPTRDENARVRACPETNCRNTCLGRRCRECHLRQIARSSMNNKREYRSDDGGFHDKQ
jgi:hypothetical protein